MWGGWEQQHAFQSVMHLVSLPFHEFGHVLFMFFGRFLQFLGGSLFQIVLPLIPGVVLLVKQRDPFGGALCLWWSGECLLDLAPYIADARSLALTLVSEAVAGEEADAATRALSHDWHNILSMLGLLKADHALATVAFALGCMVMFGALAWAGRIVSLQYPRTRVPK